MHSTSFTPLEIELKKNRRVRCRDCNALGRVAGSLELGFNAQAFALQLLIEWETGVEDHFTHYPFTEFYNRETYQQDLIEVTLEWLTEVHKN